MKPVNAKGNQPWIFTGRADAEAPKLWPPDMKNQFIGKSFLDAGTDSMDMNLSKLWEIVKDRETWGGGGALQSMGSPRAGHDLAMEQQQQMQDTIKTIIFSWEQYLHSIPGNFNIKEVL